MRSISPYIPPVLSLLTAYLLAVMALFRGRLKYENILLALVCISWTLTSLVFVCHYLTSDEILLLKIERGSIPYMFLCLLYLYCFSKWLQVIKTGFSGYCFS